MISKLDEYLVGIAVGIRFRANFAIEDQLGRILDTILYSRDTFFGPAVFPKVNSNMGQRVLINEETYDKLTIDNSNFLLEIQFGHENGFSISDCDKILMKFDEQIIKKVMDKFGIQEIIRLGLVKRYIFPIRELAQSFVDKTIGGTLEGINDINLSFSKKMPVPGAFVSRDVNDWSNAIFNVIKRADLNEIFMSVDYQLYYSPHLERISQIKFNPFITSAEEFISDRFLPWLNTNYVEG